jgi:hypothetical protein
MILQDLANTLSAPHPATPYLEQGTAVNTGVRRLLEILTAWTDVGARVPTTDLDSKDNPKTSTPTPPPRVKEQTIIKCNPVPISAPRVVKKPHQDPRVTRTTRSNSIYAIGTIVRKRFADRKYYEGEVTHYDCINATYTIKFKQGDTEEYTHE